VLRITKRSLAFMSSVSITITFGDYAARFGGVGVGELHRGWAWKALVALTYAAWRPGVTVADHATRPTASAGKRESRPPCRLPQLNSDQKPATP